MGKTDYEKMEDRLKALAIKIDLLEAKVDKTTAKANIKYDNPIKLILRKHRSLGFKESGGDAWKELKSVFDVAWVHLEYVLKRAISNFKKRRNGIMRSPFY